MPRVCAATSSIPRQIDNARMANEPRIQRSEYSSTSFRRLTSSSTTISRTTLTTIATICTRSITFESPDSGPERDDDHREQDPRACGGDTERGEGCPAALPRPREDRHLLHAQIVAAE